MNLRLQPWIRRLATRLIAIVPAFLVIYYLGEEKTGDLLVLSQVILSLQLGFAIIPLIHFVSNKKKMGSFAIPLWQKIASWISASVIVFLNCQMLYHEVKDWLLESEYSLLIGVTIIPFMIFCLGILLYIVFEPLFKRKEKLVKNKFHGAVSKINFEAPKPYATISISVDFSSSDSKAINKALQLGGKSASYILIHVLESTNAVMYGEETNDEERDEDTQNLISYKNQITERGSAAPLTGMRLLTAMASRSTRSRSSASTCSSTCVACLGSSSAPSCPCMASSRPASSACN